MKNSTVRWIIVFVLSNIAFSQWQSFNDNAASRFAAMAALTQYHSLRIDPYLLNPSWSKDWAQGPDGFYYSNKPPLPIIVGEPLFWTVDKVLMNGIPDNSMDRDAYRWVKLSLYNWVLSIVLQVLPFAFLGGLCLRRLKISGASPAALQITAATLFFGNTAAVMMNLYFGHPMAACCVLAAVLAIESEDWGWASFFLTAAFFCDYGAAFLYPGLLFIALWHQSPRLKNIGRLIAGAALPTLVGGIYHTICFGRPWRTALQYEAPVFNDLANTPHSFWGLFHSWPSAGAILQLIAGPARGLLFTQPWTLLVFVSGIWIFRKRKLPTHDRLLIFTLSGFILILGANACFGQWHAGWTIGPRYICSIFPALALLGGLMYDQALPRMRTIAWVLVGMSLLLCLLIFAGTPYVPPENSLWFYLARFVFHQPQTHTLLRVGLLSAGWTWALTTTQTKV